MIIDATHDRRVATARSLLLGALTGAALIASAPAATYNVPREEPIVSIHFPDNWKIERAGEYIETTSPKGALHVLVLPVELNKVNESFGEAIRYLRGKSGITVKPESVKQKSKKLDAIEAKNVSWEGKDSKRAIRISFTILPIAEREPVLFVYWASPQAERKHQLALKKMLQSIKRIEVEKPNESRSST